MPRPSFREDKLQPGIQYLQAFGEYWITRFRWR